MSSAATESPVAVAESLIADVRARIARGETMTYAILRTPRGCIVIAPYLAVSPAHLRNALDIGILSGNMSVALAHLLGVRMDRMHREFIITARKKYDIFRRRCSNCGHMFETTRYVFRCEVCKRNEGADWP
ncbi:MAG: hypothetical protein ACYDDA_12255 [Acidiferrobacteraceae bacterium]